MHEVHTKIATGVAIVLIAIAIVLHLSNNPRSGGSITKIPAPISSVPAAPLPPVSDSSDDSSPVVSLGSNNELAVSVSTAEIIAKIKNALAHPGSRHTYATFSKLSESVDATNVRELLAFVQTLPKPQEKNMLVSLFVARWAELDPSAALAYAQALPGGVARNWALTSVVTGWA